MADVPVIKKMPKLNALLPQKDPEYKCVEPDEWYVAEFTGAEIGQGKFGPYIKFNFELCNGNYEDATPAKGHKVTRLLDATLSPSRPLWQWATVITGKEPNLEKAEGVDLTSAYGEKFRVLIKDRKKKKDDDKRYQEVDTIKRRKEKE